MITVPYEELADFCAKNHIKRLAVFGSHLHGTATSASDLDLLVEFEPQHVPGLRFFEMEDELGRIFNMPVELHTPGFLSRHFRDEVLREAEEIYVAR